MSRDFVRVSADAITQVNDGRLVDALQGRPTSWLAESARQAVHNPTEVWVLLRMYTVPAWAMAAACIRELERREQEGS